MSLTGVFGLALLAILSLTLIGPRKLPRGMEQLWLALANLRRSQENLAPWTLDQARLAWQAGDSAVYDAIQILYGAAEHLIELRQRIFVVLAVIAMGAILAGVFVDDILELLQRPAGNVAWIFLRPADMVWVRLEVVFSAAAVLALPVLVYEVMLFVRPALELPREIAMFRTLALVGAPSALLIFIAGLLFAYFLLLPAMLQFLLASGGAIAAANWDIRAYYSFVLMVLLWVGAAFETPIVMALLARVGLVSPASMVRRWQYAVVGIAVVAAAITPTVDPLSMLLVMAPLLGLYAIGILMARAIYRRRSPTVA